MVLVLEEKFVCHQWTVRDGSKCDRGGCGEDSCEIVFMVWRTFCEAEVSIVTLQLSNICVAKKGLVKHSQPWSLWETLLFPAVLWLQCFLLSGVLQIGLKPVWNYFDGAVSSFSPSLASAMGSQIVWQQKWTWLICTRAGAAQCCGVHWECKRLCAFQMLQVHRASFQTTPPTRNYSLQLGTLEIPTVSSLCLGEGTLQLELLSCTEEFSLILLIINIRKIEKTIFQKAK